MNPDILRIVDVFLDGAQRPLIVVVGPTASGKTAFSIELAKHVGGEVINADSRQLYRFLDIGTAKISEGEMEGVPHHLLSVKNPDEEVTVGWFQSEAMEIINEILRRHHVPLLVGGSMLYVSSITDDLSLGPAADPALRGKLMDRYDEDGGERLYRYLQKVDPDAAFAIHRNNKPRLIRAVEIYELLKEPKSAVLTARKELRPREAKESAHRRCSYDLLIFGVERSVDELKRRIADRTEAMFEDGWIGEVGGLLARGFSADDPGMRGHGYREVIRYLEEVERGETDSGEALERLKQCVNAKARQYVKRQLCWWRNDRRIRWVHP